MVLLGGRSALIRATLGGCVALLPFANGKAIGAGHFAHIALEVSEIETPRFNVVA
jgi:hypothetical protein